MQKVIRSPSKIDSTIIPPGDKSISIRAVLLNAISNGNAKISNYCLGADGLSMIRCLRGLGIKIVKSNADSGNSKSGTFIVHGKGPYGFNEPLGILNAGNSGTSMRLLAGLMSSQPNFGIISGDQSLRNRPMTRIIQPLSLMGATIRGRENNSLPPLAIFGGKLQSIRYKLPVASAQLKSCILVAGLYADGETIIHQPTPSRDHTERMLRSMGAKINIEGNQIGIHRSQLSPIDINVPGDLSAAAFWLVAACCHPSARIKITRVGINPTRTGIIDVLKTMGAKISIDNIGDEGGEPVADIIAESSELTATEIGGEIIPTVIDELPVIALAACFAKGTTIISGAKELRVKESDRIKSTVEGLISLGAKIEEKPDGMAIKGIQSLTGNLCQSYEDHRIAMTMAIAGLIARGETTVTGAESVNISYPDFWNTLDRLTLVS